ncbi:acyl-CoA dehydrogenase [Mitsuaria sp. WAJ17]|uniref:acyl-CoA dehydrogenase family protein n=1 Tax=Mitsuaria sp. WAJ17 TaxID=2761452 RepID=UPI002106E86E|nr:acyl-CoA dehydrogenase [Mitsuaria sp. WAJ17]
MESREDVRGQVLDFVFDGKFERYHADLAKLLEDPIFNYQAGLNQSQAGHLTYERSRFVHARIESPLEVLSQPYRLFALAEWPALMDVAAFSVLMVHYNLTLGSFFDHGLDRPGLAPHIKNLNELQHFGPFMATELGYGNNVAALRTTAEYDPATRTFRINTPDVLAQKYMSYSGFSDIQKTAVVMARLKYAGKDHGVYPFAVPLCNEDGMRPGIIASPCPEKPVQGLDNGLTWFDNVQIPAGNALLGQGEYVGEDGQLHLKSNNSRTRFLSSMSRIVPGRLCVASAGLGSARASVYLALKYAGRRLTNFPAQGDAPIIAYRSHHGPLFRALANGVGMTALLNRVKREYVTDTSHVPTKLSALISVVKCAATWEATSIINTCRERCGAQGIFSVNRIADYVSLLQGLVTAEGDNAVLMSTAISQLLGDSSPEAPAKLKAVGHISAGDVPVLLDLIQEHKKVALRNKLRQDEDADFTSLWNSAIEDAIDLGTSMAKSLGSREMVEACTRVRDAQTRQGLEALIKLFGLVEIERSAVFCIANGLLQAADLNAIQRQILECYDLLLTSYEGIIDGFGISEELLRAPLAASNYAVSFTRACGQPEYLYN